jgi:hypothetical protein
VGVDVETTEPESEAAPRLGESAGQILVSTPRSARDESVGLATDARCDRSVLGSPMRELRTSGSVQYVATRRCYPA